MGIICAGSMWLIFVPSADEKAKQEKTGGTGGTKSRPQSSIQNSAQAYYDIDRTLGSFYEKPREDPEKEALKQELGELKNRMSESEVMTILIAFHLSGMRNNSYYSNAYIELTLI